jgi:hypothetical protein
MTVISRRWARGFLNLFGVEDGEPAPRAPRHDFCTFQCKQSPLKSCVNSDTVMAPVMLRASTILGAFEQARTELVGKAVILTDGKAGTVEDVWLDEWHGLRISIKGHDGKWPISTLKFTQMD